MAKTSGLGGVIKVEDASSSVQTITNDVTNYQWSSPRATQDVTGVDKSANETILLLEGEVDVVETKTGKKHSFKAGDIIGLSSGMHVTWTSKGPFSKKLWVITRDKLPE